MGPWDPCFWVQGKVPVFPLGWTQVEDNCCSPGHQGCLTTWGLEPASVKPTLLGCWAPKCGTAYTHLGAGGQVKR